MRTPSSQLINWLLSSLEDAGRSASGFLESLRNANTGARKPDELKPRDVERSCVRFFETLFSLAAADEFQSDAIKGKGRFATRRSRRRGLRGGEGLALALELLDEEDARVEEALDAVREAGLLAAREARRRRARHAPAGTAAAPSAFLVKWLRGETQTHLSQQTEMENGRSAPGWAHRSCRPSCSVGEVVGVEKGGWASVVVVVDGRGQLDGVLAAGNEKGRVVFRRPVAACVVVLILVVVISSRPSLLCSKSKSEQEQDSPRYRPLLRNFIPHYPFLYISRAISPFSLFDFRGSSFQRAYPWLRLPRRPGRARTPSAPRPRIPAHAPPRTTAWARAQDRAQARAWGRHATTASRAFATAESPPSPHAPQSPPPPHAAPPSGIASSTSASALPHRGEPDSPRLGESYLAIKRRTHRQSYFESYPERGAALSASSSSSRVRARESDGREGRGEEEGDSYETFGRATIRRSLSAWGGGAVVGKERDWYIKEKDEDEDDESFRFPTIRSTRSAHTPHTTYLKTHGNEGGGDGNSSSSSRTLAAPKPHTHPYSSFRADAAAATAAVPALRYSDSTYSSSQTQADTPTPPQTPVDGGPRGLLGPEPVHVIVAAPVSGVEAMDAFVDGMDCSDDDDLFRRIPSPVAATGKEDGRHFPHGRHPLYAPPLPKPPPGIILGGPTPRHAAPRKESMSSQDDDEEEEEEELRDRTTVLSSRRTDLKRGHGSARSVSSNDMQDPRYRFSTTSTSSDLDSLAPLSPPPPTIDEIIRKHKATPTSYTQAKPKAVVPSISEIIRKNTRAQTSPSTSRRPGTAASVSVVAAEVQQTLRTQKTRPSPSTPASAGAGMSPSAAIAHAQQSAHSTPDEHGRYSYYSYKTTPSVSGGGTSVPGSPPSLAGADVNVHALQQSNGRKKQSSQKDAVATYLHSARVTTLLKLTRRPHASPDRPLTVSLSDLGSPTGFPLLVFLGLGCVRYVMGLYDEMAECLGLRLITIDRWGLGRTDVPPSSASRGVPEWSTVVDEVLDRLNIDRTPSASSATSVSSRRGSGGGAGGGYRWLKYVPNGILKTAQAAEWKIQAWMIGKPPKITYEGIGYNLKTPVSSATYNLDSTGRFVKASPSRETEPYEDEVHTTRRATSLHRWVRARRRHTPTRLPGARVRARATRVETRSATTTTSRTSAGASRAARRSSSSAGARRSAARPMGAAHSLQSQSQGHVTKKKTSGFLRIWKGIPSNCSVPPPPPLPSIDTGAPAGADPAKAPTEDAGREAEVAPVDRLAAQQGGSSGCPYRAGSRRRRVPVLPQQDFDSSLTFGLEDLAMSTPPTPPPLPPLPLELDKRAVYPRRSAYSADTLISEDVSELPSLAGLNDAGYGRRAGGRRSVSFTTTTASYSIVSRPPSLSAASHTHSAHSSTLPPSTPHHARAHPTPSPSPSQSSPKKSGESYQVALGTALIAASHAESARGTHPDLLQILNHEQRPWGFAYARYPHRVRVWYGDRDERIAANAVRWMESAMGPERCAVTVVKGADHGLMYRTSVVVDVLEQAHGAWTAGKLRKRASSYELGTDPFQF
ncbi:hypothetical protein DFH11DRAFT_1547305 [Phellopilus nigrolimitatus]|nr:hypothetical protein DFH11DRAFT_1547305 [Phellopilus nigrolimitatus]